MARSCPWVSPVLFLVLIATSPPASDASVYSQLHTVISLAHSLMARVANLRAARGDVAGSRRARLIAEKLERGLGLGFVGAMWSVSWDYLKNYAWRDMASVELFGIVSDANELHRLLGELTRLESDTGRAAWVSRNYQNVLRMSKSLFRRLLAVFQKSGPLRELVVTLQTEFEGDLLRDCLELGAADMKGLVHIFKDIVLQYTSLDKQEL